MAYGKSLWWGLLGCMAVVAAGCGPARLTHESKAVNAMLSDKGEQQTIHLKRLEELDVAFEKRGTMGLQALHRMDKVGIVDISELPADPKTAGQVRAGAGQKAVYRIKALQKGSVKVTFYETQPWDRSFKDIIQKELTIEVVD